MRVPDRPRHTVPTMLSNDRDTMSRPVHVSIRDDLRLRLSAGEWRAGERLPSETDLAARYGVARMTIRQAVEALASTGAVVRRQGIGTFAAEKLPTGCTDDLMSFADAQRAQGRDVRTALLKASVGRPAPAAREALRLGESAAAVLVRRSCLVGSSPVLVQASWLPFPRFAGLDAEPLLEGSLYAMLEERYGVRIVRARLRISIAPAGVPDATLLRLRPGDPVLRTARTTYDISNLAIEYAVSAMRPGYQLEMVTECLSTSVPDSRPRDLAEQGTSRHR
jgi:GntR family transcriptional regulator